MMKQLVAEYGKEQTLLLNTGNAFNRAGEVEQHRAELILQAYSHMGYDAYALGPYDAVFGLPELVRMANEKSFRLICTNLSADAGVNIDTHALIRKDNKRILVTSIVDPWLSGVRKEKKGIDLPVENPDKMLSQLFSTIPHDLSILVVHTTKPHLEDLLQHISVKPDLVVLGYQGGVFPPQTMSTGNVLVANNNSGKTLCAVDLAKKATGWSTVAWLHKTLLMDSIVPEPQLDKLIVQQEKWESDYLRLKANQDKPRSQGNFYLGADWCARCHGEIFEKWRHSRHADAIAILKQQGRQDDFRCLPCHVTGMAIGESQRSSEIGTGFVSLQQTPHLANVQCEACHGPGKLHSLQPKKHQMLRGDSDACQACHTEETSPGFKYDPTQAH